MKEILYDDSVIELNSKGIKIYQYYFPSGLSKIVPWESIRQVHVKDMNLWNGGLRMWGMGTKPYWFHNDLRMNKKKMIIIDNGKMIKPVITPDRPEEVIEILKSKVKVNFD